MRRGRAWQATILAVLLAPLAAGAQRPARVYRIGLIGTASTTYLEPYNAARLFASSQLTTFLKCGIVIEPLTTNPLL